MDDRLIPERVGVDALLFDLDAIALDIDHHSYGLPVYGPSDLARLGNCVRRHLAYWQGQRRDPGDPLADH